MPGFCLGLGLGVRGAFICVPAPCLIRALIPGPMLLLSSCEGMQTQLTRTRMRRAQHDGHEREV
jgi:hypothetical protein